MFAVAGSKFEGTGFENVQMVQTHVAVLGGGCSTGGALKGLSARCSGDAVPLRGGVNPRPGERDCSDDRLDGLGTKVTFADDLRNPACISCLSVCSINVLGLCGPYVELVSLNILQVEGDGLLPRLCLVDIAYAV